MNNSLPADSFWVLPDIDILLRSFDRRHPNLSLIERFRALTHERRLLLMGWVRQAFYERCQQMTQMKRLAQSLRYYPELKIEDNDYVSIAERRYALRSQGASASTRQLLLWSAAERVRGYVWSLDQQWNALGKLGCPVVNTIA